MHLNILSIIFIAILLIAALLLGATVAAKRTHTSILLIFQTIVSFVICAFCSYLAYAFYKDTRPFLDVRAQIFGLNFQLEPLGIIFMVMISVLWFATNIYSLGYFKNSSKPIKYYFCILASIFSAIMLAIAGDLITAFLFYELLTLFTFPLIITSGTDQELKAANKYILSLVFFSLTLLLPAIVLILHYCGSAIFTAGGIVSSNLSTIMILVTFLMFLYGSAKIALIPVHFWLPSAMVAPIPVSALLHAVAVVKAGLFIFLKVCIYIYGIDCLYKMNEHFSQLIGFNFFALLIGLSVVIASFVAFRQAQLKKLLAYSTINNMSLCLLPLSMFSIDGIKASVLQMISHAVGKITLFFAVGYWERELSIKSIQDLSAAVFHKSKFVAWIFVIAAFSIIGFPPLAGFASKAYTIYVLLIDRYNYIALAAILLSTLFGAHYFGQIIYRIFFVKTPISSDNSMCVSAMKIALFLVCVLVLFYAMLFPTVISFLDKIQFYAE